MDDRSNMSIKRVVISYMRRGSLKKVGLGEGEIPLDIVFSLRQFEVGGDAKIQKTHPDLRIYGGLDLW